MQSIPPSVGPTAKHDRESAQTAAPSSRPKLVRKGQLPGPLTLALAAALLAGIALPLVAKTRQADRQADAQVLEGDALKQALIGTWGQSDDGGKSFSGYDRFETDGGWSSRIPVGSSGVEYKVQGRWKVAGPVVCMHVTSSTMPAMFAPDSVLCAKVLQIDAQQHRFQHVGGKAVLTAMRTDKAW